jgi:hypothetical protein
MKELDSFEFEGDIPGEESFLRGNALTKKDTNNLLEFENISVIKVEGKKLSSSILDDPRFELLNFDKLNGIALTEGNEQRKKEKKVTFGKTYMLKNTGKTLTKAKLNTQNSKMHPENFDSKNKDNRALNSHVADEKKHIKGSKSTIGLFYKKCDPKHDHQIKNPFNKHNVVQKTKNPNNLKIDVSINLSEKEDHVPEDAIIKPPSKRDSLSNHKISLFQPIMRFGKTMTPNTNSNSCSNLKKLFPTTRIVKKITPKSAKSQSNRDKENIHDEYNCISEKISDIFDRKFEEKVEKLLEKFKSAQQDARSGLEIEKDNLIEKLQELYESRMNKVNEINRKYEDDLFTLKGLIDYLDPLNVNNLIYNSVMKDKMVELEKIEENFRKQKQDAFNLYGIRKKKSVIKLDRMIEDKTEEIKKSLTTGLKSKIINSLNNYPDETSQFQYSSDNIIEVDMAENGMRHTVSFKN